MTCREIKFDGANEPERCKCRPAVLRAYGGLLAAGQPECVALEAAKVVYSHHHPEDSQEDAGLTVERWICAGKFH